MGEAEKIARDAAQSVADRMAGSARLADLCQIRPGAGDIMAEIFRDYDFSFGGGKWLSDEVFAHNAFFPILSFMACQEIERLYGVQFDIQPEEDPDGILGMSVRPNFRYLQPYTLYMLTLYQVCRDVMGSAPGPVYLDTLHEWAYSEDKQRMGFPRAFEAGTAK